MKTLIKNGTVVTASDTSKADVLVDGEKVVAIGTQLEARADQTLDAEGRLVMPGAVDVHTHMELPFGGTFASDDFATGTAAAAWAGRRRSSTSRSRPSDRACARDSTSGIKKRRARRTSTTAST